MGNPAKAKGDRAELELARILTDQLGQPIRRKLGAGRADDQGDLDGLSDITIEVKNYRDIARACREGLADLEREMANAGTALGVCFVRLPGGRYMAVMGVEQWAAWYRETIPAPVAARPEWDQPLPGLDT